MTDQRNGVALKWLLILPLMVYALSYLYLCLYHSQVWLFDFVIHESGKYTLLQTIIYASHFLGHIPSLSVIAIMLTGSVLTFQSSSQYAPPKSGVLVLSIACFILFSVILSIMLFGSEDTYSYILQQRQGVGNDVAGGSWNLHLPSTMTLFVLLPVYVFILKIIFRKAIVFNSGGIVYYFLAAVLVLGITSIANRGSISPVFWIWTEPRYLAHSIRELVTFPLTFFPLALYYVFKRDLNPNPSITSVQRSKLLLFISILSGLAVLLVAYQIIIPLTQGIGNLAQKPAFAHGGKLSIPYLVTSHFFEHVLDSIYFTLLSLVLWNAAMRRCQEQSNLETTVKY